MKIIKIFLILVFVLVTLIIFSAGWLTTEGSSYTPTIFTALTEKEEMTTMIRISPRFSSGWGERYRFFGMIRSRKGNDKDPVIDVNVQVRHKYHENSYPYYDPEVVGDGISWISNLTVENEEGERFVLIGKQKRLLDMKKNKWLKFEGFHGERISIKADIHYLDKSDVEKTYKMVKTYFVERTKSSKPGIFGHRE